MLLGRPMRRTRSLLDMLAGEQGRVASLTLVFSRTQVLGTKQYRSENREKEFHVYYHQRVSFHQDNDSSDVLRLSRVFLLPYWQQKHVDVDEIYRSIVRQLCCLFKGGSR